MKENLKFNYLNLMNNLSDPNPKSLFEYII